MRSGFVVACAVAMLASGSDRAPGVRVSLHVAVEQPSGAPVEGVRPDEFVLLVDSEPRQVESVAPASQPLSILFLLDSSQSMEPYAAEMEKAAATLAAALRPLDRIRVGTIEDKILFSRAFTTDKSRFTFRPRGRSALRERSVQGGTPLWDAVTQATELLASEEGRRVLLVFSDGRATGNHHSLEDAAILAGDSNVTVMALAPFTTRGLRQAPKLVAIIRPAASLDRLAKYTGGILVGGYQQPENMKKELQLLADRLRSGYTLTFTAPADGRRRGVSVRVNRPGLHVRAPVTFRVPMQP